MADHGDRAIGGLRQAAGARRHAQAGEEVPGHQLDAPAGFRGAGDRDGGAIHPHESDDVGERVVLRAHLVERRPAVDIRRLLETEGVRDLPHLHQPIRVADRQRAQQQIVDEAEERRVGADAERERQRDHGGERRTLQQHAHRIADVLRHRVGHGDASLFAVGFAEPLGPAEPPERDAARFVRRQPAAACLVHEQLEMGCQLFVELSIDAPPQHRRDQARAERPETGPGAHSSGPPLASTRPMTAARRSQYSVSTTSWRSPARVMA